MKKIILLPILGLISLSASSQLPDSLKTDLDLLRAPSSPAANLLSFSTSDIEKPSDVSDFMLSLQSATSDYSKLPSSYAVDLAPFYILKKNDFTTKGLSATHIDSVFKQSFVISIGFRNPDSTTSDFNKNNTYSAFGFKFSIFRGKYDIATGNTLNKIGDYQVKIINDFQHKAVLLAKSDTLKILENIAVNILNKNNRDTSDPKYRQALDTAGKYQQKIKNSIDSLTLYEDNIDGNINSSERKELQALASKIKLNRVGFFWDWAGGLSLEYINKTFNNSNVYNAGIWTNLGWDIKSGLGFYILGRYLYNPNKVYADDKDTLHEKNLSTLDGGLRIFYSKPDSKFSLSAEGIYRRVLNKNILDPTWKLVANAQYELSNNKNLTLSFGKDFDGTITKSGNLIAALTLLAGFGNRR